MDTTEQCNWHDVLRGFNTARLGGSFDPHASVDWRAGFLHVLRMRGEHIPEHWENPMALQ